MPLSSLFYSLAGAALVLGNVAAFSSTPAVAAPPQKIYRIMAVGDSITEGGPDFVSYRYPLWEKLMTAGYLVEYVGSRSKPERIGPLQHEGYSGKNAEFLAQTVPASFQAHPADIVLLACGHNHSVEEHPVPGILSATESMIQAFRAANPKVTVLVAQVIPSGKLPKYSYIPDLNLEIGKLANRLNKPDQRVMAVNMADGFDWATDTIADKVHPNAQGAQKIAAHWFDALTQVMEKPNQAFHPKIMTYKTAGSRELTLHIFSPEAPSTKPRPAIVFFFGGGWTLGTPIQFYPECAHFAAEGLIAISADYRIKSLDHTTPFESVTDGKSAIRWIRQHAAELGVDSSRIIASGGSAGGHVAAATGLIKGLDETSEDQKISSAPNALVLWYPVVDTAASGSIDPVLKDRIKEISPIENISHGAPPTLIFLGTKDQHVSVASVNRFKDLMQKAGARCEVQLFEGAAHPIYEYRKGGSPLREQTLALSDRFLDSLGFLKR